MGSKDLDLKKWGDWWKNLQTSNWSENWFSTMEISEVAKFIAESTANNGGPMLGSKLGSRIRRNFPGFNFGKLKNFVVLYCSDKVQVVGEHGGDVLYAPLSQSVVSGEVASEGSSKGSATPLVMQQADLSLRKKLETESTNQAQQNQTTVGFWEAFTNPVCSYEVVIDIKDEALRIVSRGDQIPPGTLKIPTVTDQEHARVASDFLKEVAPEDRYSFQRSFDQGFDWRKWRQAAKYSFNGKYNHAWDAFRAKSLTRLFESRLEAASVGLNIEKLREQVEESREAWRNRKVRARPEQKTGGFQDDTELMRRIAMHAVSRMSRYELAKINVPLGMVIAVFKAQNGRPE